MTNGLTHAQLLRPLSIAIAITLIGEAIYFVLWGVVWFPEGDLWRKAGWTATCGIAMGVVVGAAVLAFVHQHLPARRAFLWAGGIYAAVLSYCTGLCFLIAESVGYFGASSHPTLFIGGAVVPILLTAVAYAWLVTRRRVAP